MVTSSPGPYISPFLFLLNHNCGFRFLVDTGAEVSIVSPSDAVQENRQEYSLRVANNSALDTFGERLLQLDLGLRHSFPWMFTIANTKYSILGADFLRHFNVLIDIKHHCFLDVS